MKKYYALLLTVVILFTSLFPTMGLAQYDKELEKAIIKAKTLFGITEEYDIFHYDLYKYGDTTRYNMSWNDSENKLGPIQVTMDADCNVLSYYYYGVSDTPKEWQLPAYSKSQGLEKAKAFIEKLYPELLDHLLYKEDNSPLNVYDTCYYYYFIRLENGIPYYSNSISVRVNHSTGEVESFNMDWDFNLEFPKPDDVMNLSKAQLVYWSRLGPKLIYKYNYNEKPYLVFTNVYPNNYIDAITGEVISNYPYFRGALDVTQEEKAVNDTGAPSVQLTPEELKALEDAARIMNEKEAEELVRRALKIDDSLELRSINLYRSWSNKDDYTWNLSFDKRKEKDEISYYYSVYASIDAKTGEFLSFYKYYPLEKDAKAQYNREQALAIAEDFIQSMRPEMAKEVEYTDWRIYDVIPLKDSELPLQQGFTFTRKAGGAYFPGNGFNITVDAVTGEVISYNFNWYKDELPSTDGVLSDDEVFDALYEKIGLELLYIPYYSPKTSSDADSRILPPIPVEEQELKVKLVYGLNPNLPVILDAFTGEVLDWSGKPYMEERLQEYNDIEDSPARAEIEVLAAYGISLPGEEFKPKQEIAQKDFLYLLQKAIRPYYRPAESKSMYDDLYDSLIRQGIVKEEEKNPDATVNRLDAAKFILRAMNYSKVAEIPGIYGLSFKDADKIAPSLQGYAALAYGLKIIPDDNGYFRPLDALTREESAVIIYNFLKVR